MGLGSGQRVFKKTSPDGNVTMYVDRRAFIDHLSYTEPIDGVVVVDRAGVGDKKVFVAVVATFRFGREEDEILGMTFCRELYLTHDQVWPPLPEKSACNSQGAEVKKQKQHDADSKASPNSPAPTTTDPGDHEVAGGSSSVEATPSLSLLNEKVVKGEGEEAINFSYKLPGGTPPSAVMQHGPRECGDSCGVRYFLRCYIGNDESDKPLTASTVDLAVRKVQFAPEPPPAGQPSGRVTKDFPLSPGKLCLEASLEKKLYLHGEEITVSVVVQNNSGKTVKHIKAAVVQVADICMFSTGRWKVHIAASDNQACSSVQPGTTYRHQFRFRPSLIENRTKYGIFTQAKLTSEEDCLASSTIVPDKEREEFFGIIISYYVKVKLCVNSLNPLPSLHSEVSCTLPFMLMHPDPTEGEHQAAELRCPCEWTTASPEPETHSRKKGQFKVSEKGEAVFQKMASLRIRHPHTAAAS